MGISGAEPGPEASRVMPGSIGPYTLVARLGEGGMGVVWEAEQESPRRSVALKVVRGGGLGDEATTRLFQREAQTLARLDHHNIAAIYEAGRTDEGQHYFAMELVRGTTLDGWSASRPALGTSGELATRLRLFETICDAVHYAHQKGVIHRDLKPGNIVVTDREKSAPGGMAARGLPTVKVLDFGLARITDEGQAGASLATELGVIKGTLAYMSPEQARGDPAAIDTRTDVYALGVLLYELLTGRRPHDLSGVSVVEAVRRIEGEPALPLERAWPARERLDPDLATIVHKALAPDPDQRYSSAAALSEDLERFQTSQPILARPPSTLYQLRKLIARRKTPFAAAGLGLVLLVAFGIGMSFLYARSARLLGRALEAELEAEENFALARGAVDRFFTEISESPDLKAHGLEQLRRRLLETARGFYQDFVARQGADKSLRSELGSAQIRLANVARILGEIPQAEQAAREGLRLFGELVAEEPENRHYRRELAVLEGNLGLLLTDVGRSGEAEAAYRRALELDRALPGDLGRRASDDSRLANAADNLGQLLERLGRFEEAELHQRESIRVREALWSAHPENPDYALELLQGYNNLAILFARRGLLEPAEPILLRAIPLAEGLAADHPGISPYENVLAVSYSNLAGVRVLQGELEEAARLYGDELVRRRALARRHPGVVEYELFLGSVLCNLGEVEARAGRHSEALPALEEAARIFDALLAREPRHAVARAYASYTHSWRAGSLERLGRFDEAAAQWEHAVERDDQGDPALREGLERARRAAAGG